MSEEWTLREGCDCSHCRFYISGYNQAIDDVLALRKPMIDLGNRQRLEALRKKVN